MMVQKVQPETSSWSKSLPWITLAIALMAIALVGYLLLQEISILQEQVETTNSRLARLSEEVETSSRLAESAGELAREAEEFARIAAEGRQRAEQYQAQYRQQAEAARERAAEADQMMRQTEEELAELRRQRNEEMNRLQRALDRIADTQRTERGVRMNLGSETVKFDFDQATIKPEYREILSRIAGVLLTSSGYRIQIYGHTDNVGSVAYNQELSEKRAAAVRNYLVEAGVDPDLITTVGMGKSNPLVSGSDPEARAKNRRVEIGIIDTVIRYDRMVEEQG